MLQILQHAVQTYGQTVVMVTHDPRAAAWADSVVMLVDGSVVHRIEDPTAERVASALAELGGV